MGKIDRELIKRIFFVMEGLVTWNKIKKEVKMNNDVIVLLPEKNEEMYKYAGMYVDDLLIQGRKDKIIFLVSSYENNELLTHYSINVKKIYRLSEKEISRLLLLYQLYQFDNDFYVASFTFPFGRNADKLLKDYPFETAYLFATCIYRIIPQTQKMINYLQEENE